jgi:DNA-binding transcriptional regulator YhcF (GntR family)
MTSNISLVQQIRSHLDEELRSGGMPPGQPISIKDVSARFRVSGTPVREALERLVGEGRVIATGSRHGFAVPRFGVRALAGLYSFASTLIELSLREHVAAAPMPDAEPNSAFVSAAFITESVMAAVTDRAANPIVIVEAARISAMLAPYRAVEPLVVPDWHAELDHLRRDLAVARSAIKTIRNYTKARTDRVGELMDAAEHGGSVLNESRIYSAYVPDIVRMAFSKGV